jgi:hypothetical protein
VILPSKITLEAVEYIRNAMCDSTAPFVPFDEIWLGNSTAGHPMVNITHTHLGTVEKIGRHKYTLSHLFPVGVFNNETVTEVAVCNMYGVPLLYFSVTPVYLLNVDSLNINVDVTFGSEYDG